LIYRLVDSSAAT